MKKKIISNVIVCLLVAGIVSAIGVGAATLFASSDVVYDNTNSGAVSTDVQGALDELYELANAKEYYNPYAVGTPVYYNPVSGSKCFDYVSDNSLNNNKGATTDTECMKWYIIGEDTDTIDMILDHNTTKSVEWYSSADNSVGPTTALAQLKTATNAWTGVTARTDTYTDPLKGYTIDYSGYRARLIEANELAKITGVDKALQWDSGKPYGATIGTQSSWYYLDGKYGTSSIWQTQIAKSQGASKYAWLYDYTQNCTSYGCNIADTSGNYGYWTSSASANDAYIAWHVRYSGYVGNLDVTNTGDGLRPVITIPKDFESFNVFGICGTNCSSVLGSGKYTAGETVTMTAIGTPSSATSEFYFGACDFTNKDTGASVTISTTTSNTGWTDLDQQKTDVSFTMPSYPVTVKCNFSRRAG